MRYESESFKNFNIFLQRENENRDYGGKSKTEWEQVATEKDLVWYMMSDVCPQRTRVKSLTVIISNRLRHV
jgi:hypothetical protein